MAEMTELQKVDVAAGGDTACPAFATGRFASGEWRLSHTRRLEAAGRELRLALAEARLNAGEIRIETLEQLLSLATTVSLSSSVGMLTARAEN
jgi:hypothetical protein